MLAGKLAALSDEGFETVARKILEVIRPAVAAPAVSREGENKSAKGSPIQESKSPARILHHISADLDASVLGMLNRVRQIFQEHGVAPGHLSRFCQVQSAPFNIELTDFHTNASLLAWLDEEKIQWIAKTFLIRREWIDGEDDEIHEEFHFDKQPDRFFSTVCDHLPVGNWDNVPAGPEAYFLRLGQGEKWERSDRQEILFLLAVPLARFSNERIVYKYVCDFSGYPWNYERTNIQLRAWARLLFLHQPMVSVFGCDMSEENATKLQSNTVFLRNIIHEGHALGRLDWHPEDYGLSISESPQAKETEALPAVLNFLRKHNLPLSENPVR